MPVFKTFQGKTNCKNYGLLRWGIQLGSKHWTLHIQSCALVITGDCGDRPLPLVNKQILENLYMSHRVLNKVLFREGPPRVQPFTPLHNIFDTKSTLWYTFYWQWYPFLTPSLELCIPFNCYECTAIKYEWMTTTVSVLNKNACVSPFGPSHWSKIWQISLPLQLLQQVKSLPLHIPDAWKRCPIWGEPLHIGHYKEC